MGESLHLRTCNICEAMCGIAVRHDGNRVLSIKPDHDDVFSQGHICPKAVALQDFLHDPDRLRTPRIRSGDSYKDATWEEAIDYTAERIETIQRAFGTEAFGIYLGNPNAHHFGNLLWIPRLYQALGTHNRYSSASADQLPHHVASQAMFGHGMLVPIPDVDHTDFMLIIGGNPVVSNGSMMSAPGMPRRLKALQDRGGRFAVVDPRRTETARLADQHLPIRPETDAALLLALLRCAFAETDTPGGALADHVDGLKDIARAVDGWTPERAAGVTGISADAIGKLARDYLSADSAVCYSRMGASTQRFGGLCQWLTNLLNLVSGNMDRRGGAMFTQPAFDLTEMRSQRGRPSSYGKYHSRVRGLPYYNGEFPVATLAEEIETPGDGQIRGLMTIAGNPVLSAPNGDRLASAFKKLEFMVSLDIYENETSGLADVLLPPASGLEAPHYDLVFHALAVRNTARYSPPMQERPKDSRYDWEIMEALIERLTGQGSGMTPEDILRQAIDANPLYPEVTFESIRKAPHGVDLGPLRPCLTRRLQTPDGRIHAAPEHFIADIERFERSTANAIEELSLIGRRLPRQHNTWTHNSHRLIKGRNQCTLHIHPQDASERGLQNGDTATVSNHVGAVEVEVEITDDMMAGVVSLPQGFGPRKTTTMHRAKAHGGASINSLTDDQRVDVLTGNAAFNGVGVAVKKASVE